MEAMRMAGGKYLVAVGLIAACAVSGLSKKHSAGGPMPRSIAVAVITPSAMPIQLADVAVTEADGRGLSRLTLKVMNGSDAVANAVRIVVGILDQGGRIKSAESWIEHVQITPHDLATIDTTLRSKAVFGDRAVLVVQQLSTGEGTWTMDVRGTAVMNLIKSLQGSDGGSAASATFQKQTKEKTDDGIGGLDTVFCQTAFQNAVAACTNGVSSFSCDQKNEMYSFSCK
jgi:hypothetical protein